MWIFYRLRAVGLLAGIMIAGGLRVEAQVFGLGATASAGSLLVSNSLTYTINVTNQSGFSLADVRVTNTLSGSFQLASAIATQGSYTNYGNAAVFDLGPYALGGVVQLTLTVQPLTAGFLTNQIVVGAIDFTNTVSTNLVTSVTNPVPASADLAVAMFASPTAVITNDLMTYGVTVTNAGPNSATGAMLTNTLPPSVILESVSPTSQAYTVAGSNLVFNLGTLTNGSFNVFQITVEPANAGVLPFAAAVGAPGVTDPNPTNNTASTNVTVIPYPASQLVASITSTQLYNPQNGLVEQTITVSNAGPSSVPAVRVVVTGLTNQLFNVSGTNSGNPFVACAAPLPSGQTVSLLLQFFANDYFSFSRSQLNAFAVPLPDLSPNPLTLGPNVNLTRIVELANGTMLVEFPSVLGRGYAVVYSDNVLFSNARLALPPIVAPANRTQWIDYGPPATVSAPLNSRARFYRVFQKP